MFLPIFIALLMGLISPANPSSTCNGGTVYVSNSGAEDPGTGDTGEDPGDTGDEPGPGAGSAGGNQGQNPPPKP